MSNDEESLEIEKILLSDPSININATDIVFFYNYFIYRGATPLHISCKYGNINSVALLLQAKNIDINIKKNGKTAKDIAHEKGFNQIELLIQNFKKMN